MILHEGVPGDYSFDSLARVTLLIPLVDGVSLGSLVPSILANGSCPSPVPQLLE